MTRDDYPHDVLRPDMREATADAHEDALSRNDRRAADELRREWAHLSRWSGVGMVSS